mmetsp:Transcript_52101/g.166152  ORF Transcript_52101/g.166152 Transcript_52101/m.166152 type:complete len:208 (+) Transcript_52101:772-1395(+)
MSRHTTSASAAGASTIRTGSTHKPCCGSRRSGTSTQGCGTWVTVGSGQTSTSTRPTCSRSCLRRTRWGTPSRAGACGGVAQWWGGRGYFRGCPWERRSTSMMPSFASTTPPLRATRSTWGGARLFGWWRTVTSRRRGTGPRASRCSSISLGRRRSTSTLNTRTSTSARAPTSTSSRPTTTSTSPASSSARRRSSSWAWRSPPRSAAP